MLAKQVSRLSFQVSGPLLDRFDIHLEVAPVEFADLSSTAKEESSASIRERVQKARDIQNERFKGTSITCNARITSDILQEVCPVTDEASKLLETFLTGWDFQQEPMTAYLKSHELLRI